MGLGFTRSDRGMQNDLAVNVSPSTPTFWLRQSNIVRLVLKTNSLERHAKNIPSIS